LDEASGLKKKDAELVLATLNTSQNVGVHNINTGLTSSWNRKIIKGKRIGTYNLLSAKLVQRSQLKFKDKIDNSNTPFIPIIKDKPNSIKPLSILPEINDEGFESYSHPYEIEIEKFQPNDYFLQIEVPKVFLSLFLSLY
jgi:exosome complex exonuclease RRP6